MPHCGCDTTRPYNFATVPDWDANRPYNDNDTVKSDNVVYKARGTRTEMISQPAQNGMPPGFSFPMMMPRTFVNMGQRPPNPDFWNAVPFDKCFDTSRCAPPAPTSPPPVEPPPMASIEKASAQADVPGQYVLPEPAPTPYTDTTSIAPPPGTVPYAPYEPYDDVVPLPDTPMLPNFSLPKLPELPEIETKHMILGVAGVLTLILLFKK